MNATFLTAQYFLILWLMNAEIMTSSNNLLKVAIPNFVIGLVNFIQKLTSTKLHPLV